VTPASSSSREMHPQLMLLLELQDLRAQHRELEGDEGAAPVEAEHFNIDRDEARTTLGKKIEELEDRLSPSIRSRYNRIAPNRERVVVPVINGVCYGCFVSIATATVGDQDVHQLVQSCENCGSFIYVAS